MPRELAASGSSKDAPAGEVVGPDGTVEGTSFAAPHVSAAAALLLAAQPTLTNDQVMEILEHSARDLAPPQASPATTIGHDALTGYGLVEIDAALTAAANPPPPDSSKTEPNDKPFEATPLRGSRAASRRPRAAGTTPTTSTTCARARATTSTS